MIPRFRMVVPSAEERNDGDWCRWSDVEKIIAELEKLKADVEDRANEARFYDRDE